MSTLRLEMLTIPTAAVGPENPLPPFFTSGNLVNRIGVSEVAAELQAGAAYGRVSSIAPYLMQDQYSRNQSPAEHAVVVLENEVLRATFLLTSGGRLWSLVHKPTGRDLVFQNGSYQPANLALRNAWVAGGIEWNFGTIGHGTGTSSPIHAARTARPDGTPVLRLFEFDRIREVVYQIDAYLPDGSEVLFVHVRIVNPNDHEVPLYWWSNIAVGQTSGTRVVAGATMAWNYSYDEELQLAAVAPEGGFDASYPARAEAAADYFFDLENPAEPWIAAVDESGCGLLQTSTRQLRGRKMFRWGAGAGGRHWQEWLVGAGREYLEIQGGLARTQLEHVPLAARAEVSWLETYGLIEVDPVRVHGSWTDARDAVSQQRELVAPAAAVDAEYESARVWTRSAPGETVNVANGWGALERILRSRAGDHSLDLAATPFPNSSLDERQSDWLSLLETGAFPEHAPDTFSRSVQVHPRWEQLLEQVTGWQAALHRGSMRAHDGDLVAARVEWLLSVALEPNVLAYRNLAALAASREHWDDANENFERALTLVPHQLPLLLEALGCLVFSHEPERALALVDRMGNAHRLCGRVRLLEAQAALGAGDLERCGRVIGGGIEIADLREGEGSLHELWWNYQAALKSRAVGSPIDDSMLAEIRVTLPLPPGLDFRMHE